jgi:hypothetical protein
MSCQNTDIVYEHLSECLAIKAVEHCQLLYSPVICVIISLAGLAKVIAMVFAAWVNRSRMPPLLTTGDAAASFLGQPDNATKGVCWASSRCIQTGTGST